MKLDIHKMRGWVFAMGLFVILSCTDIKQFNIIFINHTASVPLGLYLAIPTFDYRDGDLVVYKDEEMLNFAHMNGWIPKEVKDVNFIKHIAVAGSVYHLSKDGQFLVHGDYIGMVSTNDGKGHALPQLPKGYYVIQKGEFLPYTRVSNSFDGRYTGTIKENQIIHRVIPLLTW